MKIKILLILLSLLGLWWLAQVFFVGFQSLVSLVEPLFYQEYQAPSITVPKTSSLPVEAQICRVFGKDCRMALAVSQAENGTRKCDRVSSTGDVGVFQINYAAHWKKGFNLFTCYENIQVAKQIYDRQGWSPWTVYKTGAYKKYLTN